MNTVLSGVGGGGVAGNNPGTLGNTRSSFERVLIIVHDMCAPGEAISQPVSSLRSRDSKTIKKKEKERREGRNPRGATLCLRHTLTFCVIEEAVSSEAS